jgi:hypothetical protein
MIDRELLEEVINDFFAQAHKAKALGFDQPELAQMLTAKNKWKEPAN